MLDYLYTLVDCASLVNDKQWLEGTYISFVLATNVYHWSISCLGNVKHSSVCCFLPLHLKPHCQKYLMSQYTEPIFDETTQMKQLNTYSSAYNLP